MTNVYSKLSTVREEFLGYDIKKTGNNTRNKYFELRDFLPTVTKLFRKHNLCGVFSVKDNTAYLEVVDADNPDTKAFFSTPFGSSDLPKCSEMQNIGACITYSRRYLWACAIELVEDDILDSTLEQTSKPYIGNKKPSSKPSMGLPAKVIPPAQKPNTAPVNTPAPVSDTTPAPATETKVDIDPDMTDINNAFNDCDDLESLKTLFGNEYKLLRDNGASQEVLDRIKFTYDCHKERLGKK